MSVDAYEIRCAGSSGTDRLCRKKVGAALRTEWGHLEFEGTLIGDGPYETDDYILRFYCPVHGDLVGYANEFGDSKVYWATKEVHMGVSVSVDTTSNTYDSHGRPFR